MSIDTVCWADVKGRPCRNRANHPMTPAQTVWLCDVHYYVYDWWLYHPNGTRRPYRAWCELVKTAVDLLKETPA